MYIPTHFREERPEVIAALIRDYPLATLVSTGESGLVANHIPMLYEASEGPHGVLRGHLARANPQWQEFLLTGEALAIFQGPDAYISPSLYPSKAESGKVVPTWNYVTVHAWGPVTVCDSPDWLREFLPELTRRQEESRLNPWAVTDAPEDYIANLMRAVVGIELRISRIEGKWKVSQNQPRPNAEGAASGVAEPMAELIRRNIRL